jgi:membrane protease YdiL (CAAX protease family)
LLAIALGIFLALIVPLLTWVVSQVIPPSEEGTIAAAVRTIPPALMLFGAFTAGVTEEVLYRGYPIERIIEMTGKRWIALFIPTIAFVIPHMVGWNFTHLIAVVLPFGFIFSALYLWKRNLIFNMIVHFPD